MRIRLFTIRGLATPAPYGGKQRQIMVDVDPEATAAHNLSTQDVLTALLGLHIGDEISDGAAVTPVFLK